MKRQGSLLEKHSNVMKYYKRAKPIQNGDSTSPVSSEEENINSDEQVNENVKMANGKEAKTEGNPIKDLLLELRQRIAMKNEQIEEIQSKFVKSEKLCDVLGNRLSDAEVKIKELENQNLKLSESIKVKETFDADMEKRREEDGQKLRAERVAKHNEFFVFQKQAEELLQQAFEHQNKAEQAMFEAEKVEEELSKSVAELKKKDQQIAELQKRQTESGGGGSSVGHVGVQVGGAVGGAVDGAVDGAVGGAVDEMPSMESESAQSKAEFDDLKIKFDALEKQLIFEREKYAMKDQSMKVQNLPSANAKLEQEKEKLEKELSAAQKSIKDLQKSDKEELNQWILKFSLEISAKEAQINELKKEMAENKLQWKNVEQQISNASTKCHQLEEKLLQSQKALIDKDRELSELQKYQIFQRNSHDAWVQKTKLAETQLSKSREQLSSAFKQVAEFKAKNSSLQNQLSKAESIILQESEIQAKAVAEMKAQIQQLTALNASFKAETKKLEIKLSKTQNTVRDKIQQIHKLENQVIGEQKSNEEWTQKAKAAISQLSETQTKLSFTAAQMKAKYENQLKEAESAATAEKESHTKAIDEMKTQIEQLTTTKASKEAENEKLQQQLAKLKKQQQYDSEWAQRAKSLISRLLKSETKMKAKCGDLQNRLKMFETSAGGQIHEKVVKELKAKNVQMAVLNASIKSEKERIEKEFIDFKNEENERKLKLQSFYKKICIGLDEKAAASTSSDKCIDAATADDGEKGSAADKPSTETTTPP